MPGREVAVKRNAKSEKKSLLLLAADLNSTSVVEISNKGKFFAAFPVHIVQVLLIAYS
jgi:hypothetical protein